MAEIEFYDYDVEFHTKYRSKGITSPKYAFVHLLTLKPNKQNAFLMESVGEYKKWNQ